MSSLFYISLFGHMKWLLPQKLWLCWIPRSDKKIYTSAVLQRCMTNHHDLLAAYRPLTLDLLLVHASSSANWLLRVL